MTLGTGLHTLFFGKLVGRDDFGNKYYQSRRVGADGCHKRWVIYKGLAEPSKVPAAWHGWLHYTTDEVLDDSYAWQRSHVPNLTGTDFAYRPPGHILAKGKRDKAVGDIEVWEP